MAERREFWVVILATNTDVFEVATKQTVCQKMEVVLWIY